MKKLSIVRHAKSNWEYPELSDCERPLLNKGIKRTLALCNYLTEHHIIPDKIVSSTAVRANETAVLIKDAMKWDLTIEENKNFYPGFVADLLEEIKKTPENINHLMIVGHNPSLTDLANQLVGKQVTEWLPTSGMISIEFKMDAWNELANTAGKLVHEIYPKKRLK